MKKYIILICFTVSALKQINAQQKLEHLKRSNQANKKELIAKLNLTQEQQSKIKDINTSFRQKEIDLKANNSMNLGECKQKISNLKQERKNTFEAMLTVDQKSKLESYKLKRHEERKAAMAARFEQIKSKLQLTQEQETSLKNKRALLEQQIVTIKNNNNLTQQQKLGQIKSLHISQNEYFKSILTQAQLQKMEQNKTRRK